jgi:DNA invertase Pin-like site-specific DNA recombinase
MKTAEKPQGRTAPKGEAPAAALARSAKIAADHLAKLAIVYVRQSSPRQVLENRESTARQYAFADEAVALGWPRERVLIIDEDLGKSGRTAEGRSGFQRLIAEVTLNHVGMVHGLEMSRLARASKDWHAFFEMCALFDTLIADEDGVYDGNDANDRLLLGLKGIMSEMELHIMRNRLDHGRLNKARRGELFFSVPLGYVLSPTGKVEFDPDEQARAVVQMLFDRFDELGSVFALFHWMIQHGVSLPIRPRRGATKGRLEWRRPSLSTLAQVLHHPMYAGAYAYGRRPEEFKKSYAMGKGRKATWLPMDQWQVLIRDHLPAYIAWERYLQNQERLKQNQTRADTRGTPRKGRALLAGLVVCGNCGWRMSVSYRTKDKPHYRCMHHRATATEKACLGLSANVLDELVTGQVLRALEPAALELSLKAQTDLQQERERLDKHWQQQLQRARYDVELAERRYQAVDPDNRLVAATLERQWEDALRRERTLKEECERCGRQSAAPLSAEDRSRIAALASDIPALWHSPQTTNADRQALIRCLVDRVVVHVTPQSEQTEATIHWAGSYESRIAFARPIAAYGQRSDFDEIMDRIVRLHDAGKSAAETAKVLNEEGISPLRCGRPFNDAVVRGLLRRRGVCAEPHDESLLQPGEWWIRDLADAVGMPWQTLRDWAVNGWAHARQTKIQKVWIIWADAEEVARLRRLRAAKNRGTLGYPAELTTPKRRPRSARMLS